MEWIKIMIQEENFSILNVLQNIDIFAFDETLVSLAESIFDFTQYLLDDDDNLTKTGNLKSSAEALLEKRIDELILPKTIELEEFEENVEEN